MTSFFQADPRQAEALPIPSPASRERGRGEGCRPSLVLAGVMAFALSTSTQAQPPTNSADLRQHALAATCAACHGTGGRAPAGSAIPSLAGRPAAWVVEQMQAFRSGTREATVMHQIARGYDAAQIEQLAAFFAAQRP